MCGINLIIDKKGKLDESVIQKMNNCLQHRGPEASGYIKGNINNQSFYLGNTRLKIFDPLAHSDQPFKSSDQKYFLSFNGAILNYKELKETFAKEYEFHTTSDTEVLFSLLQIKGRNGIAEAEGMFAFIFCDLNSNSIHIARDRKGIKPLYYYEDESYFIASSEIRAIIGTGLVPKELNEQQVLYYLTYKYPKSPETFYKNIFELAPGTVLEYFNERISITSYLPIEEQYYQNLSDRELVSKTKSLLVEATRKHLLADVPVGILLSGGVDSTLLLAISNEIGIKNIPTFSIINSTEDSSFGTKDNIYSRRAAIAFKSSHNEIEISEKILERFQEMIDTLDQPIADSAALLTYVLSENITSNKIKVVLSGAGADEYFGGYSRHLAFYRYIKYFKNNLPLQKSLKYVGRILPDGFNHPLRKSFRHLKKFSTSINQHPHQTFDNFSSLNFNLKTNDDQIDNVKEGDFLNYALTKDRDEYLISDILAITDKMSMKHGLEVRVPYLDTSLINFVKSIKPEILFKNGSKWILKSILDQYGYTVFSKRKKEGFGLPFGKWIKNKNYSFIENLKDRTNPIYNYISFKEVELILNLHMKNKEDYTSELWALVVLSEWLKKNF